MSTPTTRSPKSGGVFLPLPPSASWAQWAYIWLVQGLVAGLISGAINFGIGELCSVHGLLQTDHCLPPGR